MRNGASIMGFTDRPDIDIDEIDHVSAWLMKLAIGMMVLGAVFATLDWFQLLPSTPPAAAQVHADTNS
jgi:hypothetical protein